MTFVLDASAVLRWIDQEAGAMRVEEIITSQLSIGGPDTISALHYGEIYSVIFKRCGLLDLKEVVRRFSDHEIMIAPVTGDKAAGIALIKAETRLPYVMLSVSPLPKHSMMQFWSQPTLTSKLPNIS